MAVIEPVARLRHVNEPVGAFAVEVALANFVNTYAIEGSLKLTLDAPFETSGLLQQHIDGYPAKVAMPRSAKLDYQTLLRGLSARVDATPPVANTIPDHFLWLVALGGAALSSRATLTSGTTTVLTLGVTAASVGITAGTAVALPTGAGGALEARIVKETSGNTVTLKQALSATPANGMTVYGGVTYYLDNTYTSTTQTLQQIYEGLDNDDRWLLRGGQLAAAPTFEVTPGSIPKITWSWLHADWDYANGVNTTMNLTSAPLADQNLSEAGVNAIYDSELRLRDASTSTIGTPLDATEVSIALNLKYAPIKTPSGLNGIRQMIRLRPDGPPLSGEFVVPFEDTTWQDARDQKKPFSLTYQIGMTLANGGVLIEVPHLYIDSVQREGIEGIAGWRVGWYAKRDIYTTANTSALEKSPIRIHRF